MNLLEVHRDGCVGSLHCCNRCLAVLSDPLVQVFAIGAVSFVQFIISPLGSFPPRSSLSVSFHAAITSFSIVFSFISVPVPHGSRQPVVAFGHQQFPSGPVTSSGVFCNSSALLIGTFFFPPFISEPSNLVCPVWELSHGEQLRQSFLVW